jgi:hypothetical protein
MHFARLLLLALLASTTLLSQPKKNKIVENGVARPKLVVGLVVDQMRWDFLYRYYDRYSANGFKRLLNQGFSAENTMIPYVPTVTACGHTCLYTGSVPAIHGIVGNNFYDRDVKADMYCAEDKTVKGLGTKGKEGLMSPRNMKVTSICDELRLATNFRSKVIGVAIKDRGGILPAGHSANAAYWYDGSNGNWISSNYYMEQLPDWVSSFNNRRVPDSLYKIKWDYFGDPAGYVQSDNNEYKKYEATPFGNKSNSFPYALDTMAGKKYGAISSTPMGMDMTMLFAKTALMQEGLGKDAITDFLAISLSSPDYIGHSFGPNSQEIEDTYLRLDALVANFLQFLDQQVGAGNYTLFLSADHGVAHNPSFLKEHRLPGGMVNTDLDKQLNKLLVEKFGADSLVASEIEYEIHLDNDRIAAKGLNRDAVVSTTMDFLNKQAGVDRVIDWRNLQNANLPDAVKKMLQNGYNPHRSGDLMVFLLPQWLHQSQTTGTTHGLWNPYDAHIPLLFYGWGIKQGKTNRTTEMTDVAATLAALLKIQMPNGCIGEVITEVIK